jgi:PAS domain S-box-containing protein
MKILLIEDNPADADLVAELLPPPFSRQLTTAGTLRAGLKLLSEHDFDIVVTDMQLPDSQGFDTVHAVQQAAPRIPIVVLTGRAGEEMALQTIRMGAQDYLDKSTVNSEILARTLRYAQERFTTHNKIGQLNQVLRTLRNLDQLVIAERNPDKLLDCAARLLVTVCNYDSSLLIHCHDPRQPLAMAFHASRNESPVIDLESLQLQGLPTCMVEAFGRSQIITRRADRGPCADCAWRDHHQGRDRLAVSMSCGGKHWGVMNVALPTGQACPPGEVGLLGELAGDLAFALLSMERTEQRRRSEQRQQLAIRLLQQLNQSESPARIIGEILDDIKTEACVEEASVYLLGGPPPCPPPCRPVPDGPPPETVCDQVLGGTRGKSTCFSSGGSFWTNERSKLSETDAPRRSTCGTACPVASCESVAVIPLRAGQEIVGILQLADRKVGRFTPDRIDFLESVCNSIGVAVARTRAEEALVESEHRFRQVFAAVDDGILFADSDSRRISLANRKLVQMLGYDAPDLLERSLDDLCPAAGATSPWSALARGPEGEQLVVSECAFKCKDGTVFVADVSATTATIAGQQGLLACLRDATQRRQLQATVVQSDRLASMGMLAAGVVHEVNNPLVYILNSLAALGTALPSILRAIERGRLALEERFGFQAVAEVLGDDWSTLRSSNLSDVQDFVRTATDGTHEIRDIISGIGSFSRIARDQHRPIDIRAIAEVAVTLAHNEIKYRARLTKQFGPVPLVMAGEGSLSQAILNLVINAAHSIEEGEAFRNEIRVETRHAAGEVCLLVEDTGRGIEPEVLPKVFEPFFSTKGPGLNLGVGLAITKQIIEGYGGRVEAESSLGQGSRFTVYLPAYQAEEKRTLTTPQTGARGTAPAAPARILVVDDEEGVRAALSRLLRAHEVVCAADGREGQSILQHDRAFDLVLCDMMMPGLSGMDLHGWLTTHDDELAGRFAFVSGGAFQAKARNYLAQVDLPLLEKNLEPRQLRQAIEQLLAEKRRPSATESRPVDPTHS